MITSQVSYNIWKMLNFQTIETPKKAKNSYGLELKLFVDAIMLKTLTRPLTS